MLVVEPHPQNVPGPFYVENGCCITCGIPEEIAPDIFGWAEGEPHCVVRCQPSNAEQLDRTLKAMWSGEVDCIRYRGTDPTVVRRIAEFGSIDCCDFPVPGAKLVIRNHVCFRSPVEGDSPLAIADRFRAWLASERRHPAPEYRVRKPRWWNRAKVVFSWEARPMPFFAFNAVRFREDPDGKLSARMRSGRFGAEYGLALMVHEWLEEAERASEIRWFSRDEAVKDAPGLHMPI